MRHGSALKLAALIAATLAAPAAAQSPAPSTPAARVQALEALYPPWPHTANEADTDAAGRGLRFTVAPVDVLADFHGNLDRADLVLYVSGNYFFAMAGLVEAFGNAYRNIAVGST